MPLMASITGAMRASERPNRMIWDGEPWARDMAISAPIDEWLGPVMRTGCLLECWDFRNVGMGIGGSNYTFCQRRWRGKQQQLPFL